MTTKSNKGSKVARSKDADENKEVVVSQPEERPVETVLIADRLVVQNGRSIAITIPKHISEAIGMNVGGRVRIEVQSNGALLIVPMQEVHLPSGGTMITPKRIQLKAKDSHIPVIPGDRTIRGGKSFIKQA